MKRLNILPSYVVTAPCLRYSCYCFLEIIMLGVYVDYGMRLIACMFLCLQALFAERRERDDYLLK